jgi:hypothetical protein
MLYYRVSHCVIIGRCARVILFSVIYDVASCMGNARFTQLPHRRCGALMSPTMPIGPYRPTTMTLCAPHCHVMHNTCSARTGPRNLHEQVRPCLPRYRSHTLKACTFYNIVTRIACPGVYTADSRYNRTTIYRYSGIFSYRTRIYRYSGIRNYTFNRKFEPFSILPVFILLLV